MMQRCTRCVYPVTKPDLHFGEDGVCSGCRAYEARGNIDWTERRTQLTGLLERNEGRCVVASSGGKDSHAIALTLIGMGAKVTVVTATTDHLSLIGKRNIENLARFSPTYEVTPNQTVRRKISRIGLTTVGDISYGEHIAIWSTPFQMAAKLGIPLVFFGENPQNEMGGPQGSEQAQIMTPRWISEYGGLLGLRVGDLIGQDGITEADMEPYRLPPDLSKVTAYFLGQFMEWDGLRNAEVARENGFEWWPCDVEGSIAPYESLDNHQTGQHEWLKYLKYGYMRPTDMASLAIRRGRMQRAEALKLIQERETFPATYLGMDYREVIERIGVTESQFDATLDRFLNRGLFDGTGRHPILKEFAS